MINPLSTPDNCLKNFHCFEKHGSLHDKTYWSLYVNEGKFIIDLQTWAHFRRFYINEKALEQRQYKNGFVSVEKMFVLNFAALFLQLHSKEKVRQNSKQTCFPQKWIHSYIVLALGMLWDTYLLIKVPCWLDDLY